MNRRSFFAFVFAAPLAAVAALKMKPLRLGGGDEIAEYPHFAASTKWSNARSTPIADIEAAMKKIRAGTTISPQPDFVWLGKRTAERYGRIMAGYR